MRQHTRNILFMIVFGLVFLGMHYLVLSSMASLFSLPKNVLFYLVTLVSAGSYIAAMMLEKKYPTKASQALYTVASTWLGVIFLLFFLVILVKIISLIVPLPPKSTGAALIVIVVALLVKGIKNTSLDITHRTIEFPRARLKKNLKIAHLSDIHLGTIHQKTFLEKVVAKTNELKPDVIMITGDLVDGSAPITQDMLSPLNNLKAPTFYVIGNHEIYDDLRFVMPILSKTKMRILRNQTVNYNGIQIAGVDFHEGSAKILKELEALKIQKGKFTVLLNHAPTGFPEAVAKGVDLQLSGHTHNGQIFPFTLLVRTAYKYITGLHKINNSYLNISQGVGTWGPPFRILSHSEIVVLNLKRV
jgi:uncharacterized protein